VGAGPARYWDEVAILPDGLPDGWRRHGRRAHLDLVHRWVGAPSGCWLKTDLYEERTAVRSLLPALGPAEWIGIDVAPSTVRHAEVPASTAADVRRLPFRSAVFDGVLSTSTLDHFEAPSAIEESLRELHRVLRPGGQLVLTLDNPGNPLVRVRNALPPRLARRTGLVPFDVGATLGLRDGVDALTAAGFVVLQTGTVLHAPHVVGTRLARWRWWEHRVLPAIDRLGGTRAAGTTGHFVAFHARRTGGTASSRR